MAKIIVVGVGQGGLVAAKHLADFGHEVHVYEAKDKASAVHPWRDDIRRAIFEESGLKPLEKDECASGGGAVQKGKWKFVSPDEKAYLNVPMTPPLDDVSISRAYLLERLEKECEKCTFHYSSPVEKPIVEDGKVKGVVVSGREIVADLVIDASGLNSTLRTEIFADGAGTKKETDDVMCGKRILSRIDTEKELPNPPCTLYVKHLGGVGISWCNLAPDNTADILIGRVGGASDDEIENAVRDLKNNHAFCSDDVVDERRVEICLRYPSTRMVTDGYATVGDSAYMAMPLMGSGIESAMKAGKMLADVIGSGNDFSAQKLWNYQLQFYKELGFGYVFVDVLKRWALNLDEKEINWAFESGLVTNDDMALISTDENAPKLSAKTVLTKIGIALKHFSFVRALGKCALKGLKAQNVAKKIPQKYDDKKIEKWAVKLDKKVRS